jgi:hypothetical protein
MQLKCNLLVPDERLLDNVGAAVGALLCPDKIIEIGPFSKVPAEFK